MRVRSVPAKRCSSGVIGERGREVQEFLQDEHQQMYPALWIPFQPR